jgi:SRSO17 transposase
MDFTENYREYFKVARRNSSDQARKYLNGLLVKAPRKNMERMEEFVGEFDYQSQQQFISDSPWSHEELMDRIAMDVSEVLGGEDSALLIDESGFSKKGKMSAGVSRQYNGRLGKVDNCQVGVYASLSDGKSSSIVDARLYLPADWIEDPKRCRKAKIPEEHIRHVTKPEMAMEMIQRARSLGLRFGWVCFDALYGSSLELLNGLDGMGKIFAADVKRNRKIYPDEPDGTSVQISTFFRNQLDWEMVDVRMGEKGMLKVQACAKRVWVDGKKWWAVCVVDPQTTETKWFLSNAPEDTKLEVLVRQHGCRFWIERGFQDGKTSVGMADYQVRGWVAWHHHMAMVMLAMLFLLRERRVHLLEVEMLSCNDIVELLNVYLPRRDMTAEQVLANIQRRHLKRKLAQESARRRRPRKKKDAALVDLTK